MTKKNAKNSGSNPMWGGHFDGAADAIMQEINESISFDNRLYKQDIAGSLAHCSMLVKQDILTEEEGEQISEGLEQIMQEIESGKFEFKTELEDIHMNIESRLTDIIGEVAGKLHTARSRNDQVATDFKLYVRDACDSTSQMLLELITSLRTLANEHTDTIMPGFTHLQTAQPVTLGHHLLAYAEMFNRDGTRIEDARARLNECPLGSAALAGTSFPIDREYTAELLDFDSPTRNSLDAVSDRDFVIEMLGAFSITAMHLSRLAEELVLWCSKDFNFVTLSHQFTTGSSIMPQKRNPDAAELIRAKTGRIFGAHVTLLTVMKGLPLAYSKDMQEDKEPFFAAFDAISLSLAAMNGMLQDIEVNKEAMLEAAKRGFSTATDLADWLVQNLGIPFRQCHHITGRIVKLAEEKNCELHEVALEEMQAIEPGITKDIFSVLSVENSVASRKSYGGTAPECVKEQLKG